MPTPCVQPWFQSAGALSDGVRFDTHPPGEATHWQSNTSLTQIFSCLSGHCAELCTQSDAPAARKQSTQGCRPAGGRAGSNTCPAPSSQAAGSLSLDIATPLIDCATGRSKRKAAWPRNSTLTAKASHSARHVCSPRMASIQDQAVLQAESIVFCTACWSSHALAASKPPASTR